MSTAPSEIFRKRLREARELRKMSQEALAKAAKLNPSVVSHFETGNRKPSFENLRRLADALRVSTDYLLGRTDDPGDSGKAAAPLFKDWSRLTADDQDFMQDMLKSLAERSAKRRKEE